MNTGINRLLGIGRLDSNFIDELIDIHDDLWIDYPELDLIGEVINRSGCVTNYIISELMDSILRNMLDNLRDYIDNSDLDDEFITYAIEYIDDIEIDNFINCLDSHYGAVHNNDFIIDDSDVDTYLEYPTEFYDSFIYGQLDYDTFMENKETI